MTGRGIIEESHILSYKLDSKNTYVREAHDMLSAPKDVYRFQPPSNITAVAQGLEKISQLSTPALVGLSMGAGSVVIILVFCVIRWFLWLCGIKNSPATSKESFTRTPPATPPSEGEGQSLPVAARPPRRNLLECL